MFDTYYRPRWLKGSKNLPDFYHWYYNPYLRQHIGHNSCSPLQFYDTDYNFLFELPEFNKFDEIKFVDADLLLFITTWKNHIVLYNITKREVVFDINLEVPIINGEEGFVSARCYLKGKNIILFTVNVPNLPKKKALIRQYVTYAYYVDKNEYIELKSHDGWHYGGGVYDNTFVFNDWVIIDCILTKYNQDLECEVIDITNAWKSLIDKFYPCYDPHRGQIMFADRKECFDGHTYYGNNYSKLAIDLTGKFVPWEPLNRVDNPDQAKKADKCDKKSSDDPLECFVNENGITKRAFEEWDSEDIMETGYTWACDRLDEIKDECKLGSVYDVFETDKVRDDILVIFGVGMLYYECENGGFSQYVLNKNDVYKITIDALKKVGAVKTCKIVEKAMKYFFKHQGKPGCDSDLADISEDEAYDNFEEQFEDYLEMAINYLREKCLN